MLSSAFERMRYLEGIRKEVCRMKLKAEQHKQKYNRMVIFKSEHLEAHAFDEAWAFLLVPQKSKAAYLTCLNSHLKSRT